MHIHNELNRVDRGFSTPSLVCINSYVTNDTEQWSLFYRQESNDKLVDAFIFRMRARRRRFPPISLPLSRSLFLFPSLSSLFNKNDSYSSDRFVLWSIFSRQLQSLYNVFLASHDISHYTLRLGIPMHLRKRMLSTHFAYHVQGTSVERIFLHRVARYFERYVSCFLRFYDITS